MTRPDNLPPLAPGWDPDPLYTEPDPPAPPRAGCALLLLTAFLLVALAPAPREAIDSPAASPVGLSSLGAPDGHGSWGNGPREASLDVGGAGVTPASAGTPTRSGTWAYATRSYGPGYLAIPEGPGWVVTVCGPLDCIERLSTDAGPALYLQRAGRIGDLASVMFLEICGPLAAGLCAGSYTIIGRPDQSGDDPAPHKDDERMRLEVRDLPATDTLGAVK